MGMGWLLVGLDQLCISAMEFQFKWATRRVSRDGHIKEVGCLLVVLWSLVFTLHLCHE